ncbi:dirigent protein 2-like [Coffea eugenioides]|uniref:dirigent protein 2-like n=1 Tax=Coffea eugenioides TaxID=49369 RepID=UPI000F605A4F|nr:dirigent protein 2-like [Coffea eugenioides]
MDQISTKMKTTLLIAVLWWVVAMMAMPILAHGSIDQSPEAVKKWFKELGHAKEKLTELHFYVHDTVTAKNPSAILVAQANTTSKSPTMFGATFVFDDPMTVGPEPSSKVIGRAQGVYSSVSKEDASLIVILNLAFNDGQFKGSTLSVLGSYPLSQKYKEMPILGGSGAFRLARGIVTAIAIATNGLNEIIEFHVLVLHY